MKKEKGVYSIEVKDKNDLIAIIEEQKIKIQLSLKEYEE